jgi:hypothetical protein
MSDDGERSGQGVGEAVVAVDAGYLFDEVDLALEVEAPGGELDGEAGIGDRRRPGAKAPFFLIVVQGAKAPC